MTILKLLNRPGKTTPRLIVDLLDYVPKTTDDGYNLLAHPAQQFRNKPLNRRNQNDCRHNLMRKDSQTQAPISDDVNFLSNSFVSAICSNCKYHFIISVSSCAEDQGERCSVLNSEYPLHHLILANSFRIQDQIIPPSQIPKYEGLYETYEYYCSRSECPIVVNIKISPPRLHKDLLQLIDNVEILENRGAMEIRNDPSRFTGLRPVTPFNAFKHLSSYLSDALQTQGEPRKIATRNKKFRLSFSDDCNDIFNYLDFRFLKEIVEGDEPDYFWELPRITNRNKTFLEDVLQELTFRATEKLSSTSSALLLQSAVPAIKQIKIILGCASYSERSRQFDLKTEEHPYYASLGAVDNFTDELLSWAYDRQCECDPLNKPYYLDCLEDLARGRESYYLQTKFAMETSAGAYGTKSIEEAYHYFHLDPDVVKSDEIIASIYQDHIEAIPSERDRARDCLEKIARHRNSPSLEALANDDNMTFDEALEILGVSADTTPEFIEASAVAMFVDGDKSKATLALKTIAKQKPGNMVIQRAAAAMALEMGELALSVEDAYKRLQISSREISDEGILDYFQSLSNRAAPGSKDSYSEALRVIALDRNSSFLLVKLDNPDADVPACKSEPVGLDNIGNTCYLNSLLQYFYSIKPLREMVMDFDKHRMILNDENLRRKRVGGRQVERAEIVKAQIFAEELQKLFIDLKTASTRSVRPTRELAALTILSTQAAEEVARKNSVESSCKSHDEQYSESKNPSPKCLPSPIIVGEEMDTRKNLNEKIPGMEGDNESEITLVDSEMVPRNTNGAVNEICLSPHTIYESKNLENDEQVRDLGADYVMVSRLSSQEPSNIPLVPDRPPPVPPRDTSASVMPKNRFQDNDSINQLWDFGTQQDVTEVNGNVLFRLQCAITATDYENPSGEQIDVIRECFFGANTVFTQKAHSLQKKVEAWSYLLVFPAKFVARSIYEALDVSFDEQMVEIDKQLVPQYTSISKLPQIMQFHIQRTDFDQENLRSWKNRTPVTIPETLYLDRYMDDSSNPNSSVLSRRRETWVWKKQLSALEARYEALTQVKENLTVPDALIATRNWISEVQDVPIDGILINQDLPLLLDKRISEVALELNDLSETIEVIRQKLQNQFEDMQEYSYTLHAVFIHHGEAGGGHYWVYIYDSENDKWRQYNDENVSEVKNRDYIFRHESVGGGTPYYVVYVRSSMQKELVDPVFRELNQAETIKTINFAEARTNNDSFMANDFDEINQITHIEYAE